MVKYKNNDQTVQETNDCSILSKSSMAQLGYFDDPYLTLFTSKVARRAPLIHRGYYIRAKAIDYALKGFLKCHTKEKSIQIISLGAGFDSSYFRLKDIGLLNNCTYIEIDFPDVVRRKQGLIAKHQILKNLIGQYSIDNSALISEDYKLIPCDLTNFKLLENYLAEFNVSVNVPTLLFSECVLTYVEYENSKKLLTWIKNTFPNSIVMIYEQIQPHDSFGQVMLKHFNKIQSPLKRIHQLESISKHIELFQLLGYDTTIGFDMNYFYEKYLSNDEKLRVCSLELFDEFEEWHLKCSHYCVVAAFQGTCSSISENMFQHKQELDKNNVKKSTIKLCSQLISAHGSKRYGHASVQLNDDDFLITGGFGVTSTSGHDKLNDGLVLTFHKKTVDEATDDLSISYQPLDVDLKHMYHTMTQVQDNMVFLYGGRVSPKQVCSTYGFYKVEDSCLKSEQTFTASSTGDIEEPSNRWRHAIVKLRDKLYLYGGRSVDQLELNDLWSFNLNTHKWKKEEVSTLAACHSHSLNVWNNQLVIYGGLTAKMEALNHLQLISIDGEMLHPEKINLVPSLPPRYSHTCHVIDDRIFVIGGIDPTYSNQPPVLAISLGERNWRAILLPQPDPEKPLMLHNHCSILQNESKVVIIGGGGNCFSFGTYFNDSLAVLDFTSEI